MDYLGRRDEAPCGGSIGDPMGDPAVVFGSLKIAEHVHYNFTTGRLTCEYDDWKQHPRGRLSRRGGSFEPGRHLYRRWEQMMTGTRFLDSRSCLALQKAFWMRAFFVAARFQAKCTE